MATHESRLLAFITALGADIKTLMLHVASSSNPHSTTKAQVGLGSVDNTADTAKPVSSAQQSALDAKAPLAHSHSIADVASLQTTLNAKATQVQAFLSSTIANSTITPAVITSHTFVIPPLQTLQLKAIAVFQSAAATTGMGYGVRVTQPAGADSQARGAMVATVGISGVQGNTAIRGGNNFNVAAAANSYQEVLGTAVSATLTNHVADMDVVVRNTATNVSTTVTVEYRSEVAGSAVTLQAGTGAIGTIG